MKEEKTENKPRLKVPESCKKIVPVGDIAKTQVKIPYKLKRSGEEREKDKYRVNISKDGTKAIMTDMTHPDYIKYLIKKKELKKKKKQKQTKIKDSLRTKIKEMKEARKTEMTDIREKITNKFKDKIEKQKNRIKELRENQTANRAKYMEDKKALKIKFGLLKKKKSDEEKLAEAKKKVAEQEAKIKERIAKEQAKIAELEKKIPKIEEKK